MKFTTSWDDGYALDLRVAEILKKYGIQGTFYVCPQLQHNQDMLTELQIKELSQSFEIGAHTLTHPKLTRISEEQAYEEIAGSKKWIEDVTGKTCTMFCYPKGDESPRIRELVKEAGYKGGRTVEMLQFTKGLDPFGMPTTMQLYPFPWRQKYTQWWHLLDPVGRLRLHWQTLRHLGIPLSSCGSILSLSRALFCIALERDEPVFHFWGHSVELERYGLWGDLETFLKEVSETPGIEHVTNSQLIS